MTTPSTDRTNQSAERERLMALKGDDVHASDASEPSEPNDEEPKRNPLQRMTGREGMMEAITAHRRNQVAQEVEGGLDALGGEDPQGEESPERDEHGRFVEGNQAARKVADPEPEPEPDMVRVVIYGEARMVPADEVEAAGGVRAYQMMKAAEVNFERSKEALDEARRLREEQAARAQETVQQVRQPQVQPPEGEVGEDGLTQTQRDELALMNEEYGEEVVDTRRRTFLLENRIAQQTSSDDSDPSLIDRIADQLERRTQEREAKARKKLFDEQREQANRHFSTHYAHIEQDPDLALIAQAKIRELATANPQRSLVEVVKAAGDYVQERFVQPGAGQGPLARRVERKRSTARAPVPSASMRVAPAPEPEPEAAQTAQQVVHQMQRARGQA